MQNANQNKFTKFDASKYKVGIVVAQFNSDITAELLQSAQKMLASYGVPAKSVQVYDVAGVVEEPLVLQTLAKTKKYDCLIALGAVVKGETRHFDYVCKIVSEGVLRVTLDYSLPIGFGILTVENMEQAKARYDVGGSAAEAALQASKTIKEIKRRASKDGARAAPSSR